MGVVARGGKNKRHVQFSGLYLLAFAIGCANEAISHFAEGCCIQLTLRAGGTACLPILIVEGLAQSLTCVSVFIACALFHHGASA